MPGLTANATAAARRALEMIVGRALGGLSIGMIPRDSTSPVGRRRDLKLIELREISLLALAKLPAGEVHHAGRSDHNSREAGDFTLGQGFPPAETERTLR